MASAVATKNNKKDGTVEHLTALEAAKKLLTYPKDEPVFILRAQDLLAPDIVSRWVDQACLNSVNHHKIECAVACIRAMFQWTGEKKFPD